MGLPERIISLFERPGWVSSVTTSVDAYYRVETVSTIPEEIKLAVVEDPEELARIDAGMVREGAVLAYVRQEYSSYIIPQAQVWWDDAGNSSGVRYEVVSVEDYTHGAFGRLGGFKRAILRRVSV